MEILFLILKIIGILLAVLILLVVALIAVPVRYGVNLKMQDETECKAVFSWLWHLVDFRIWYEKKEINYKLRILGIVISLDKQKKDKPVITKKKRKKNSSGKKKETEKHQKEKVRSQPEELKDIEEEPFYDGRAEEKVCSQPEENRTEQASENTGTDKKKKSFVKRLQELWQTIRALFQKLRQRIREIKNRTTTLKEQFSNIKNLLSEETNKSALLHLLQEMKYLLRHYFPRKASGDLNFGMEDPAQTGQILGVMSVLPFWTRYKVSIMPDFTAEAFYVKGTLRMRGHIRTWHMLVSGFRLIKDKNIRKLITKMKE